MDDASEQPEPSAPHLWYKSSASNGSCACLEFSATDDSAVKIRDSKFLRDPANDPSQQPIITVSHAAWGAFTSALATARYAATDVLVAVEEADQSVTLSSTESTVALNYTPAEWDAFLFGVRAGEFDLPTAELVGA